MYLSELLSENSVYLSLLKDFVDASRRLSIFREEMENGNNNMRASRQKSEGNGEK